MHVCMYTSIHVHKHTHTYTYVHAYTYIHACAFMYACDTVTDAYSCSAMTRSELWGLGHAYMHTCMHACIGFSSASSSSTDLAVRIHLPLHANDAVRNVAVGSDAVFLVTAAGRILAWGRAEHGRLGTDGMARMDEHDDCVREVEGLGFAMHVVSGSEHALAINADGALFSWGSSVAGRLGIGTERVAMLPCRAGHMPFTRVPERIEALRHKQIVGLACSDLHCLALASDGSVFAWGSASMGRLGIGSDAHALTNAEASQPMPVKGLIGCPIAQVVCSKANSAALSSTGLSVSSAVCFFSPIYAPL